MKVLLVNKFLYRRGGSEAVMLDTASILREHGHQVVFFSMHHPQNIESQYSRYFVSHVDFNDVSGVQNALRVTGRVLYSNEARKNMERLLENERPDVAHLHNIHHQLSPSILHALRKQYVPVVMTLHDYKMVCPVYTMLAPDGVCDRCSNGRFYQCLVMRCAKGSLTKSFLSMAEMYLHHRLLHTERIINFFISPSRFLRDKFAEMGFRGAIHYLPNALDLDRYTPAYSWTEQSIVYSGRLIGDKGLHTLINALGGLDVTCKIIGDGPLRSELEEHAHQRGIANVRFLGHRNHDELKHELSTAMFVVVPSEWYENNPMSILEAFACGKPVVGARIGGIPELIEHGKTGLLFTSGDVEGLRRCITQLLANPNHISEYGRNARARVEERFSRARYTEGLLAIYDEAIKKHETS